jgi:hypothetical protein
MSTELKTLKGQFHNEQTEQMDTTEMHLTRFSGGIEGLKLQLTMRSQGDLFTHITLNKKELKKLVKEIQTNFDL